MSGKHARSVEMGLRGSGASEAGGWAERWGLGAVTGWREKQGAAHSLQALAQLSPGHLQAS